MKITLFNILFPWRADSNTVAARDTRKLIESTLNDTPWLSAPLFSGLNCWRGKVVKKIACQQETT